MSIIGKLIDKLYDWAFEKVPVKPQEKEEQNDKFYLPCNVLFGNIAREKEEKRNDRS